ncbi:hypothetical protein G9A89_013093 [Geosiphon pyriformis]|nr:hypothetical protein G9A89_013093 [Geosiphon pyriformis]
MVLEDVTEFENTPEGRKTTKLEQILLNGNNITMLIPGDTVGDDTVLPKSAFVLDWGFDVAVVRCGVRLGQLCFRGLRDVAHVA